ncbi:MAG: AraD1 family protein [bacterium]
MIRLVQLRCGSERRVAVVDEPKLRLLDAETVYDLARTALAERRSLVALVGERTTTEATDYEAVYDGRSEWRLLAPVDHPDEPSRLLVSGTGLTHLGSAANRQAMHEMKESEMTDSMKMFRWGVERGRPAAGEVGISPEWFYKGNGSILRGHGEPLVLPAFGEDGGEEAELAGVYIIGQDGKPWRIGMSNGNEFSDHKYEKRNYLNLASSKIRTCSLGPELVIGASFDAVPGSAAIVRGGSTVWSKDIATGEADMCHSLQNVEHHHFKFESHRRPGDVHVHYFGACSLSFGDGFQLADGDVMQVRFEGFGRALRNPLLVDNRPNAFVGVQSLA